MNKERVKILIQSVMMLLCIGAAAFVARNVEAQTAHGSPESDRDDDENLRINPDSAFLSHELPDWEGSLEHLAETYPFVNLKADSIMMNDADWCDMSARLMSSEGTGKPFVIVHIGDSHLQPDISSGRVRCHLQDLYGSAGRGLVIPYRLAGTNQPDDYKITASGIGATSKLMDRQKSVPTGFTGISVRVSSNSTFNIKSPEAFEELSVYFSGEMPQIKKAVGDGSDVGATIWRHEPGECVIGLERPCENLSISFDSDGHLTIYGFCLRSDSEGLLYHTIGNNGATFSSYLSTDGFAEGISHLHPDLVIFSLGTNEAYGRADGTLSYTVKNLIKEIKSLSPETQFLLTTPSETQKRTVISRRRRRKRYSYAANSRINDVRNEILKVGKEEHIPVFDWFEVVGGKGASAKLLSSKLLSKDRIHKTRTGYTVEGELLFNALNNAFAFELDKYSKRRNFVLRQ